MSEVAKPVEPTPTPAVIGGTDSTPLPTTTDATPATDNITSTTETAPVTSADETVGTDATKVEGTEGILGYKGPGLIQSFRFSKRFFWFRDEPFKTDSLDSYLRTEKAEIAHGNAAWAHETGKGLLFFSKRAEDKAAPTGILNLAEISDVTKESYNEFAFKLHGHKHLFQTASTAERDTWIATVETKAVEAKELKEGVVGSEAYKGRVEKYHKLGVGAATTGPSLSSLSKSRDRKEAAAAPVETKDKEVVKKDKAESGSASSSDDKKTKSRSQSRKRASIFGLLGSKKEDHELKKEEKAEEKVEKQHDKEVAKEEKEIAKEEKQAEAKATHEPSDVVEASAATVAAAAPVALTGSPDKQTEETKADVSTTKSSDVHDKKNAKRTSIFGNFFSGVKDAISPTTEKTESDAAPVVPAKDTEVSPVSETAPKIEEPVQSKPIDTAAVTAPVDSSIAEHDPPASSVHAQTTTSPATSKSPTTPSHKGGVMGFFKRQESKLESKLEHKKDTKVEEPVSSTIPATETSTAPETPVVAAAPATTTPEVKPALKEKRRTSIFASLSNKREKSETDVADGETKKSPLPQKLGGIFRKPSKAIKSEETPTEPISTATATAPAAGIAEKESANTPALTNGTSEAPKELVEPAPAVSATPEVKASA